MGRLFLTACVGLMLGWVHHGQAAPETGFLDFDNLPETNFSCEGKVIGGYYADTETGCQMFHVCTIGQKGEVTDIKFLCLNGTVFDQETRVCERLDEVDCSKSESFYDLNLELYGNHATFGIQPENEETQDAQLCDEEDEEECKTEKPATQTKQEQNQPNEDIDDDEEEGTTQPPQLSSSTSRAPVTTTSYPPSTSPTPQVIQFPSSSPETFAALLALHKAFTQSLQQHSDKDSKVNPPKLTGFVETLDPDKAIQQVETFEIKSSPTLPPSRIPAPFVPKTQTQYSQNLPKTQFQSPPKPQYQSPPKLQYQSPPKTQYQSQPKPHYQSLPKPQYPSPPKPQYQSPPKPQYQSPPKTLYQEPQKPQFQSPPKPQFSSIPKPPPPLPLPPITYSKPLQTTSESYDNGAYHHSFHINNQHESFPEQNYQDQYSYHDSPTSSQAQTEVPKQYDFDYEDDYYDEKPHSSTITPYILHQLKVNQVQNANQAKVTSVSHGNFVREVSSPTQNKPFSAPSFRSVTTPGIAIITATSTTSSSSVKTSKPTPSAILASKNSPTAASFADSLLHVASPNSTQHPDPPQSYDEYNESDVRSDPFYKDVPKISRTKRYLKDSIVVDSSLTLGDKTLGIAKLRDQLMDSVFKNNSEIVLNEVLNQYCKDQANYSDSLVSNCFPEQTSKLFSDSRIGDNWKIVIPNANSDYLYLYKTIVSSSNYQNSTSNVLLLVNFPDEFKVIRDSVVNNLEKELQIKEIVNNIDISSVKSSIHNRLNRVKRNRPQSITDRSISKNKTSEEEEFLKVQQRNKRQAHSSETYGITDLRRPIQRKNPVQRTSFESKQRSNNSEGSYYEDLELRRPAQRLHSQTRNENTSNIQSQMPSRPRTRRPITRHQVTSNIPLNPEVTSIPTSTNVELSSSVYRSRERGALAVDRDRTVKERPHSRNRGEGIKYSFSENIPSGAELNRQAELDEEMEVSTTYPFNLQPGSQFICDDKVKGGYYADVEAQCYGYFICSQGEINGPLLKSHFWCGPTTKFNQRSRTCQVEANVVCSVSNRYFHLNKDILSLPDLPTTENPLPPDPFFDEVPKVKRPKRSNGVHISNSSQIVGNKTLLNENVITHNMIRNMLSTEISKNLTRTKRQLIVQESEESTPRRRVSSTNRRLLREGTNHSEEEHTQIPKIQRDDSGSSTNYGTPRRQKVMVRRKISERRQQTVPQVPPDNVERSHRKDGVKIVSQDHTNVNTSFVHSQEESKKDDPTPQRRGRGRKYQFVEDPLVKNSYEESEEASTPLPLNLQPGTKFTCDDKIKGGYYADVEADCYGYFICSQGEINGPLLKSHFWCGPTTKFNQRSRTCQVEANVACSVSTIYFHQNKDILSLPDPTSEKPDQIFPETPKVRRQKRSNGIYVSNSSIIMTEPNGVQDKLKRHLKKVYKLKKARRKKRVRRQSVLPELEGSMPGRRLSSRRGILRESTDQTERENSQNSKRQHNSGSPAISDTPRRQSELLRRRIPGRGQQRVLQPTAESEDRIHSTDNVKFRQDHTHIKTSFSDNQEEVKKDAPTPQSRGRGRKYQFVEDPLAKRPAEESEEASTPLPLNLQPGTKFTCDDKIKGGYYADVEADCYGYFICSQGEINGPLLKSHFWCGPTTKFNQRSRTCQVEANVACSVSARYFHLNKDILSLSDAEGDSKDSFEPAKV